MLNFSGECVHYELGKTYKYTYETKVLFNDDSPKKEIRAHEDVGLRIRLEFDFTPLFDDGESQMVRLQVYLFILQKLMTKISSIKREFFFLGGFYICKIYVKC